MAASVCCHRTAAFCCPCSMPFLGAGSQGVLGGSSRRPVELRQPGRVWRSSPPPTVLLKISIAMASTGRSIFHPSWSCSNGIARCFTCRNLEKGMECIYVYLRLLDRFTTKLPWLCHTLFSLLERMDSFFKAFSRGTRRTTVHCSSRTAPMQASTRIDDVALLR